MFNLQKSSLEILGTHIILELYGCNVTMLSSPLEMEQTLQSAALVMGATIVKSTFHHFAPLGVSGVVIIMESHLTVHTWPEYQYAAVDVFTCGDLEWERGLELLKDALGVERLEWQVIERGKGLNLS